MLELADTRTPRRIADILSLLATEPSGVRLKEISVRVGVPLSSSHVLMRDLVDAGLARQGSDRSFTFGPALVRLGVAVAENLALPRIARPFLEALAVECDEDAYLAVASGSEFFYADKVESSQHLRLNVPLGQTRPLHCTAAGKIFLAYGPGTLRDEYLLHDLVRFTPKTITDPVSLRAELRSVRELGFAIQQDEHVIGVAAVAAPIFGQGGELAGALSSSVPLVRFDEKRDGLVSAITVAARAIGEQLGASDAA